MEKMKPAFEENNLAIYALTDNNYAPYLGVALYSLLKNSSLKYNYDIIICENTVSETNKDKLLKLCNGKNNCSIRFIDMNKLISMLHVEAAEHISLNSYAKVFVMSEIFSDYDKILSLDSDTLILKDVSPIFDTDMEGKAIAAVKDAYLQVSIKRGFHADKRLNYKPVKDCYKGTEIDVDNYFNVGVILYDLNYCRVNNCFEKTVKTCNENPIMIYMEQDILNMVFKQNWKPLNLYWNGMSPYSIVPKAGDFPEDYEKSVRTAAIIHFLGGNKPWEDKNAILADVYMQYAQESFWHDDIKSSRKLFEEKNKVKGLLLPKGSKRREVYKKMWFAIHDAINGWHV